MNSEEEKIRGTQLRGGAQERIGSDGGVRKCATGGGGGGGGGGEKGRGRAMAMVEGGSYGAREGESVMLLQRAGLGLGTWDGPGGGAGGGVGPGMGVWMVGA
jgi:hypothetical protein